MPASAATDRPVSDAPAGGWTAPIDDVAAGRWVNRETGVTATVPYEAVVIIGSLLGREMRNRFSVLDIAADAGLVKQFAAGEA